MPNEDDFDTQIDPLELAEYELKRAEEEYYALLFEYKHSKSRLFDGLSLGSNRPQIESS
jgi:hypothetical protein